MAHISAKSLQITAGLHVSPVGDEEESDASQTSPGHGIESVGLGGHFLPFFPGSLLQNAIIMGGARCFQLERDLLPLIVKPMENLLVFAALHCFPL
jgi:hypothetical protein